MTAKASTATLWTLVEARVRRTPDSVAFIEDGRETTIAQFHEQCARTTTWLAGQGVGRGDRVAIWMVNRLEWLAVFFATARLGAVLVPINTRYRSDEVTHILQKSGAGVLFLQPAFRKIDFADILSRIDGHALPALEKIVVVDDAGASAQPVLGRQPAHLDARRCEPLQSADESDADACAIMFTTSGTTKGPKLVMHPQRTLADHAWRCAQAYGLDQPDAVVLAALPFCGVFGLNIALAALAGGAPIVMVDAFDAAPAARLMREHKVTHTFGSDEMVRRLAEAVPADPPFPALRFFGFGAFTSSFSEYATRAWERGIPLFGLYGSSEVLAIFSRQLDELPISGRIEGGGRPVAGDDVHIRIRDVETGGLLPVGESGEIEILGPSNFMGYYNDPESTADALTEDGYFRTGDIGELRGDGSFIYRTRKGDAIRLSGFLVNPVEIEEVIKRLPGVADAQVAAVDIGGANRVVAFVIAAQDAHPTEEGLIAAAAAIVAPFKVPARVWFVDEYPVTLSSNGMKTQRNKLRDMARERLAVASS